MNARKVIKILTESFNQAHSGNNTFALILSEKGFFLTPQAVPFFFFFAELTGFEGGGDRAVCFHPAISELTVLLQQAAKWKGMQ